jgi:hypothetical protein
MNFSVLLICINLSEEVNELIQVINVVDLYSGGVGFDFGRATKYSLRFLRLSLLPPGKCQDNASIRHDLHAVV